MLVLYRQIQLFYQCRIFNNYQLDMHLQPGCNTYYNIARMVQEADKLQGYSQGFNFDELTKNRIYSSWVAIRRNVLQLVSKINQSQSMCSSCKTLISAKQYQTFEPHLTCLNQNIKKLPTINGCMIKGFNLFLKQSFEGFYVQVANHCKHWKFSKKSFGKLHVLKGQQLIQKLQSRLEPDIIQPYEASIKPPEQRAELQYEQKHGRKKNKKHEE